LSRQSTIGLRNIDSWNVQLRKNIYWNFLQRKESEQQNENHRYYNGNRSSKCGSDKF